MARDLKREIAKEYIITLNINTGILSRVFFTFNDFIIKKVAVFNSVQSIKKRFFFYQTVISIRTYCYVYNTLL